MGQDQITQIRVGGFLVGIVGLKQVLESMAGEFSLKPDAEVEEELIVRLGKINYIPDRARMEYAKAFLREFKKSLGKEVAQELSEGLEVKVLGQGCAQCDRLERELMAVMSENRLIGGIEHVRDIKEIARYGVMGTPALLINGQVKCAGRLPTRSQMLGWLKEAIPKSR